MNIKNKEVLLIIATLVILVIFSASLVTTDPFHHRGQWRMYPRDVAHWLGWFGAFLLGISATYSALKRGFPQNIKLWLTIHCIPGIISLILTGFHLINRIGTARPSHVLSFFTFGLMTVIVISGIAARYIRHVRIIKDYWRTLHIPLTILYYITLTIHILSKISII